MQRRERFNAKARQSTAGGSHKKGRRRAAAAPEPDTANNSVDSAATDSNAAVILPKSKDEKELDKKERIRQQLLEVPESSMSSKKRKRLEKYIDKKVKQEERVELFKKLAQSQKETDSFILYSSATLGTGHSTTAKDLRDKQEHQEVVKIITGRGNKRRKGNGHHAAPTGLSDEEDSVDDSDLPALHRVGSVASHDDVQEGKARSSEAHVVPPLASSKSPEPHLPNPSATKVGSALKRNADGTVAKPRIVPRKSGPKTGFRSWSDGRSRRAPFPPSGPKSDTSFDSSDSAYDSDSSAENQQEDEASHGSQSDSSASGSESEAGADDASDESEWGGIMESIEREDDIQEKSGITTTSDAYATSAKADTSGPKRKLGFKEWALQQLSEKKAYVAAPSAAHDGDPPGDTAVSPIPDNPPPIKRRKLDNEHPLPVRGPLGEEVDLPSSGLATQLMATKSHSDDPAEKKAASKKSVEVHRSDEIQEARLALPVVAEEQPIVEAIMLNPVVVLCGETGSGKTTQVPQFLYEAGFGQSGGENPGMIGVTQPRRVAAMSMASRVAHELGLPSSKISYQIRYDATVSPHTVIKFMTDGVLLRELSIDFLLNKYSVIIIDEAHERSLNTDILIGVLSRIVKLREEMWKAGKDGVKPLRLIIMSATLRVSDFRENTSLFPTPPPVIDIPARQHPVTVHFSRRTSSDYVGQAIKKATRIHTRLPPGGILIFLTGQNEIEGVCRRLGKRFGAESIVERRKKHAGHKKYQSHRKGGNEDDFPQSSIPVQVDLEAEDFDLGTEVEARLAQNIDEDPEPINNEPDPFSIDSDLEEEGDKELQAGMEDISDVPMHIVPLYSLLPSTKQMKVFEAPPKDSRLVVVATNVAETSLTIPGIRYVIDCGRAKEKIYNPTSGIQAFQITWISKASASQRAGRAGRTGPGHCYRLYSSALYESHFSQFAEPEIARAPIEGVVLQMKSMHIDAVVNFPFPTPPDRIALRKAETTLTRLGAIAPPPVGSSKDAHITEVGRAMSMFPLAPRFARMLIGGRQYDCLPHVIAIVSALSVGDPFLREEVIGNIDQEAEDTSYSSSNNPAQVQVQETSIDEVRKLRRRAFFQSQNQHGSLGNYSSDILRILSVVGAYEYAGGGHDFCEQHFVRLKAMEEIHKLRAQISNLVQANFPTLNVGLDKPFPPPSSLQVKVIRQLLTAAFIDQVAVRKDIIETTSKGTRFSTSKNVPYRAMGIPEDLFIHPSSVIANQAPPDWIVFTEVIRTSRLWAKGITTINPAWLVSLGKSSLCTFSKPIRNSKGAMMVIPRFGPSNWELPPVPFEKIKAM